MKKIQILVVCMTLCLLSLFPALNILPAKASSTFSASDLSGQAYALLDLNTGHMVFTRGEQVPESTSSQIVFTDFETDSYVPWYRYKDSIQTVAMEADLQPESISEWFADCTNLTTADLSRLDTSLVTDFSGVFRNCSSLQEARVQGWNASSAESLYDLFKGCSSLPSLDLSGWNPNSQVQSAYSLFEGCTSLESLDLTGWSMENAESLSKMFAECASLKNLIIPDLNPASAQSLDWMFYGCASLESLDLSGWDVSTADDFFQMFANCSSLVRLNLSGWNTANATNYIGMFEGCTSLETLDLSGWKFSKQEPLIDLMFSNCASLKSLDLSGWDTSNVYSFSELFANCASLEELNLSGWTNTWFYSDTFEGANALQKVTVTDGFLFNEGRWPAPPQQDPYTGLWAREDLPDKGYTPDELAELAELSPDRMAGTWIWQRVLTEYTLCFDANQGSGSMANAKGSIEEAYTLPASSFYRFNYDFAGWSLSDDGSTAVWQPGEAVSLSQEAGTIVTLYAIWTPSENKAEMEDGWYYFTLKDGEKATFSNLPAEGTYTVYEESEAGWVLVESSGTSGQILPNEEAKARFVNRKTTQASALITAQKYVDSQTPEETFTFELVQDQTVVATASSSADGSIGFPVQVYDEEGVYTYAIREVQDGRDGYVWDTREFGVTVTVTKNEEENLEADVQYDVTPVFNNKKIVNYGTLQVFKSAQGGNENDLFTFRLNLYDSSGRLYTDTSKGSAWLGERETEIASGYTFTLKSQESLLFTIPEGIRYEISEIDMPAGYLLESASGSAGTIQKDRLSSASFINRYETPRPSKPASLILQAQKTLENGSLEEGQFTFRLEGEGANMEETNSLDGLVQFALSYDTAGTYTYILKEIAQEDGSVEYDTSEYAITVTVSESAGSLRAKAVYDLGGEAVNKIEFVNRQKPGSLRIEKQTEKAPESENEREFSFQLSLADSSGTPLEGSYPVKDQPDTYVSNGDVVSVKANGFLVIEGLPAQSQYAVREIGLENSGYVLSSSQNASGTIESQKTSKAQFVNTFAPEPAYVTFGVSKRLLETNEQKEETERPVQEGQFAFELLDESGTVISSTTTGTDGAALFDPLRYEAGDAGKTYTYQIRERAGSEAFVTYDTSVHTRKVQVTVQEGRLVCQILDPENPQAQDAGQLSQVSFVNRYEYTAAGKVSLKGRKILENKELVSGQFAFEVLENDKVVSQGSNLANGTIVFDAIEYTLQDVGEHEYQIREVGSLLDFFTEYDQSVYTVKVTVTDNGDGSLKTEIHQDQEPVFTNVYRPITMPETGGAGIAAGILAGTGVLLSGAWYALKKRKEN